MGGHHLSALKEAAFIIGQFLLPHHALSRLLGALAQCRWGWLKNGLISYFIKHYQVDMTEAANPNPKAYSCFNDFFTRPLRPAARPLPDDEQAVVCPVDGIISQWGEISQGRIFQAKGYDFSTDELLGGSSTLARLFDGGDFATLYLSPRDYHRVHMPINGELQQMVYLPGRLFSVNSVTTREVPRLFARNERVVAFFTTEQGPLAIVMVGAMIVASIETVWAGVIAPPKRRRQEVFYNQPIQLNRGEEMGRFKLGSTVIMLWGAGMVDWENSLQANQNVRLGQALGTTKAL